MDLEHPSQKYLSNVLPISVFGYKILVCVADVSLEVISFLVLLQPTMIIEPINITIGNLYMVKI